MEAPPFPIEELCARAEARAGVRGDINDFIECCVNHAWFYNNRWISKQVAVDNLQWLAERWSLIEQHGQDVIQKIMSAAFERVPR